MSGQTMPVKQDSNPALKTAADGTYQLVQTGKFREAIQDEVLVTIEQKRDAERVIYLKLSDNTEVMILPAAEISKPDFRPLPLYKQD